MNLRVAKCLCIQRTTLLQLLFPVLCTVREVKQTCICLSSTTEHAYCMHWFNTDAVGFPAGNKRPYVKQPERTVMQNWSTEDIKFVKVFVIQHGSKETGEKGSLHF